jgi:hypothetical protein
MIPLVRVASRETAFKVVLNFFLVKDRDWQDVPVLDFVADIHQSYKSTA